LFFVNMMKILISGANGFIGSRLSLLLSQKAYEITALVRETADCSILSKNLKCRQIDYNNTAELEALFENHDIFIHCAGQTKSKSFDDICKTNVDLTQKLINLANNSKNLKQFIFLSSQAAGGPGENNLPVQESDVPKPISWYGKSKLLAEKIIRKDLQKPWTIIRPASVYGPGDKDFLFYFQFIEKHMAVHPGLSDKYVSLIYIDDLIKIIESCILNENACNQIFNAGDGNAYTIKNFIDNLALAMEKIVFPFSVPDSVISFTGLVAEMFGRLQKKLPVLNRQKAGELKNKNWLLNNKKAVTILNFKPERKLLDNLSITYKWYKKNKWL